MDQEEGQKIRVTQERRVGVCVGETDTSSGSSPKLYIRFVLWLSYDGLSSVCILRGILPTWVISWNAHGIFPKKTFLLSTANLPQSVHLIHLNEFCGENHRFLFVQFLYVMGFGMWRKETLLTRAVTYCRWRKMWIPLLIWILHFMNFTKGLDNTKNLRCSRKYQSTTCHPHLSTTTLR